MKKRILIRSIAAMAAAVIALCVMTYGWIMAIDNPHGRYAQIDFVNDGILRIAANTLTVDFFRFNSETSEYELCEDSPTLAGMVPNETIPFRLRFHNNSGATQTASITLVEISTDNPEVLDYLYVGMSGGAGFVGSLYTDLIMPDKVFYCLSDVTGKEGAKSLRIYSTVYIPPTTAESYVELNGYFWFHRDATTDLSNISVTIGHIRIVI